MSGHAAAAGMIPIRAAVVHVEQPGFAVEEVWLEEPGPGEMLVAVAGTGICHTDLLMRNFHPLPAVFGHEGAGRVMATGPGVTGFAAGEAVVMSFGACGACDRCAADRPAYCREMAALNFSGGRRDGSSGLMRKGGGRLAGHFFGQSSFASHVLVPAANAVKVADDLPLELLGPLGCGVQTGAGAVLNSLQAEAGMSLIVTGAGGVGLSAVMGGRLAGCDPIIVVEPVAARRALALELGATEALDPAGDWQALARRLRPLGFDLALDTTGRPDAMAGALAVLGSLGVLGLVAVSAPGLGLPGDPNRLVSLGQTVRGIVEGDSVPARFIPWLIDRWRDGLLPFERMCARYPLDAINEAVADMAAGRVVKPVLIP